MNYTAPQSTMREWRAHLAQPARAASLLGASVILAVVGPFDTDTAMALVPRFAYWGAIVVLSYSVGYFGNIAADALAGARASLLKRVLIAAPLTALGVLVVVYLLNGITIGYWATGRDLAIIAGNVALISSIITSIFYVADRSEQQASPPALLDRIAFDKRAPLVALSVEDHYVRVRTIKGEELILMRLGDAIREVGDTRGLHVHRSHWVALDQITATARKGDGANLTMTNGPDIPVSRANVRKLKEAGLLPR
ncbi:MAG: LytTR family DNA-binding domain-containing protein [Octadecabacter sp.]